MNSLAYRPFTSPRLWALLILCTCLAGCSLKVTYPFMDWWLSWTVRDYISLDRDQRKQLESQLDQFHQWHQQTQLPHYSSFVETLTQTIEQPLNPQKLVDISDEVQKHWLNSIDYLLPDIDQLFMSLSDEQWTDFVENLDETQAQYAAPFLTDDKQALYKLRQKRFTKSSKRWIGKLTEDQRALVNDWSEDLHPLANLNLERQKIWNNAANELFERRHQIEAPRRQQELRQLIVNESNNWPKEIQDKVAHNQQRTYQLLLALHQSLTPKQLKKAQKKLLSYHADFQYLASQNDALTAMQ